MLRNKTRLLWAIILCLSILCLGCSQVEVGPVEANVPEVTVEEAGAYLQAEDVAEYLLTYGRLPSNYITKKEARALGWNPEQGNLWDLVPGAAIGGDVFGNREGLLPVKDGRTYYECDVNYEGGHRGPDRLVYSDDDLLFYTEDHYQSFEDWGKSK